MDQSGDGCHGSRFRAEHGDGDYQHDSCGKVVLPACLGSVRGYESFHHRESDLLMPSYYRRDDQVINGIGQCVPNGFVTYFVQPSLALATCFNDPNGDEVVANPQLTSGLGQTAVYLSPGIYTVQ